ncbi:MAG: Uma2 family endonuclease [Aridibacter sp.]
MTAILEENEIISPVLERKTFTSDEVHQMMEIGILPEESGWELINGEIIHRMIIGSRHAETVIKFSKLLEKLIGDESLVSTQNPIEISQKNESEPDIAILKMRDDFYMETHPKPSDVLLVIEISFSTIDFDRETKKRIYAEAGIVEYWLVNLEENTLEIYSNPKGANYFEMKFYERGDIVYSKHIEKLKLKVSDIIPEEMN